MAGGAWKVAYADFVTAMMALFMVLWISAQDQKILIATSQYFQNPFHSPMKETSGVLPFNSKNTAHSEGRDSGTEKEQNRDRQIEMTFLNTVAADFYRLLHLDQSLEDKPIDIQVYNHDFFVFDGKFTEWGKFIMQNLAWMIDRHHFRVTIDGHTRALTKAPPSDDRGWELSSSRANASRRLLVYYAVDPGLIERVTGYASTKPLPNESPAAEANQRVTLSLALASKARLKDSKMVETPTASADIGPNAVPALAALPRSSP